VVAGVPTVYRRLLPDLAEYDLSSLRLLMAAGETFTPELETRLAEALPQAKVFNFYGYTEIWNFIGTVPGVHPATSLGTPYDEYEAKIIDEEGRELPVGEVGTIASHGAGACLYWRLPDKQREVIKDGWFVADDLAYKDEKGIIWFKARDVDIIKSSGYLISPYEIEDVLAKHPAVAMAGCIGVPDEVKGEVIKAYLKLKPGHEPSDKLIDELTELAKAKLERYKVPNQWEFIEEMPSTLSGKTLRRGLKELELKKQG
jgi:acyl-coenzyme A synthetase/AMP-(fatty) acid ligase